MKMVKYLVLFFAAVCFAAQPQVANAAVGTIWGPYKEQNFYVVSKLVGKKPSDSTLARHILISYKGNQAAGEAKRTKEEAKKLADSIGAIVKADGSKFSQFVNLSSDVNSAAQGGTLGWSVSSNPQFVPEFQKFVDNSPVGATGVVETQFGYHIINIQDKKARKDDLNQKAMEQIEGVDYSEMFQSFKGNSAIMIAETANAPAKLIKDFRKKEEKPALKSAFVQETFYVGDNNLDTLVNIKSREEMIGEIIGLLQSPIQRVVSALQNKSEASGEAATEEVATPAEEETPATETPEAAAEGEAPAAE